MYVFVITTLMMCRHMMREQRLKKDNRIGFIDPYVVYKNTKTKDPLNLKPKKMETTVDSFITKGIRRRYSSLTIWGKCCVISCLS